MYPIVPEPEDWPGHADLPNLDDCAFAYVSPGKSFIRYPAYIVVRRSAEDAEPRYPSEGLRPGTWVTVLVDDHLTAAWIPSAPEPEGPEVEPPDPAGFAAR